MTVDLQPRTVYLPTAALADLDRRAAEMSVASGVLLRLIALGKEPPLGMPAAPPPSR